MNHQRIERMLSAALFCLAGLMLTRSALAQPVAADQPGDAIARKALQAKVVEVHGMVKQAPVGISSTAADWTRVKLNDTLASGTQIKTGLRSSVALAFGDDTIVQIRKVSLASIDDYYKTATEKSVLLGLGYGTVRGGSTEATLRTDVVVDSTVATLAKRGTEGWQIEVEPTTGRFQISLARYGLLQATLKSTGQQRRVRPNEYVNSRTMNVMWVNQNIFDRTVSFYEDASVTPAESSFAAKNPGGASVVSPDPTQATQITKRIDPAFVSTQIANQPATTGRTQILTSTPSNIRPEGDFGLAPTIGQLFDLGTLLSPTTAPRVTRPLPPRVPIRHPRTHRRAIKR